MITVYVECPFVLQLAFKQQHAEACERIATGATRGHFELALPTVALIEPLYVLRGNIEKRRTLADSWRKQAIQLKRSNTTVYQEAVAAMEEALVKAARIDDQERVSIAETVVQLSKTCRLLSFGDRLFEEGSRIEQRLGLTSVDALAVAAIFHDARALRHDRAFLSLDKKSMAPASTEFKDTGVSVCSEPASLEAWLQARGVRV